MADSLQHINCFVYQNYVDLHALSAYEAITRYLNVSSCVGLKRYKKWHVCAKTSLDHHDYISSLTVSSYYLLNPNKESFKLQLPSASKEGVISVFVDVKSLLAPTKHSLLPLLNKRFSAGIQTLSESVVWECQIKATSYDMAKQIVIDNLVPSNASAGILANPIYESFELFSEMLN